MQGHQTLFSAARQGTQWMVREELGVISSGLFGSLQPLQRLPQIPQGAIRLAVIGIIVGDFLETRARRPIGLFHVIELGNPIVALPQHFLHLAQSALGARPESTVRIFQKKFLELHFGQPGFCTVAVGLAHQAKVRHAHAELRLGRLRGGGEESDEVLIFRFRLGQPRNAPFVVIGVGDGQFRFGQKLAVRVSVQEGLQGQAAHVVSPALDLIDGPLVENLVRLVACGDGAGQVGVRIVAVGQSATRLPQ